MNVLARDNEGSRWWTWAGTRANASLVAALGVAGVDASSDAESIRSGTAFGVAEVRRAVDLLAGDSPPIPRVDEAALDGHKFSAALPPGLASATPAERMTDPDAARRVGAEPIIVH